MTRLIYKYPLEACFQRLIATHTNCAKKNMEEEMAMLDQPSEEEEEEVQLHDFVHSHTQRLCPFSCLFDKFKK